MINLYKHWGQSGAAMIITGNMFISEEAIACKGNIVILKEKVFLERFQNLAAIMKESGAKAIFQINHAGRQASRNTGLTPVAPSEVPIKGFGPIVKRPRALTDEEIEKIIEQFVETAKTVQDSGFDGVQIHAAHGYLLSQFLSPLANKRTGKFGGSLENRAYPLIEVLRRVREQTSPQFIVGVKLNSADFQRGGFAQQDAIEVIKMLNDIGIDYLEISGGNYESPSMMGTQTSTVKREAYFLEFAKQAKQAKEVTKITLLLTGGFRSSKGINDAISSGSVDLAGIARPMIIEPNFPRKLLQDKNAVAVETRDRLGVKKLDDMLQIFWYKRHIRSIARSGTSLGPKASRWKALFLEVPKELF